MGKKKNDKAEPELEEKEQEYRSKSLNGSQVADEAEVSSTDLEKITISEDPDDGENAEDAAFGAEHNTDDGGLYKRTGDAVLDQDSDSPPAGVAGHPGIDEDTA